MTLPILTRRSLVAGAALGSLAGAGLVRAEAAATVRAAIAGFSVLNTLDPAKASLLSESYVIWAVFNALLRFNARMEIEGDLAATYTVVDSTTLEFSLRPDARFHDGAPVTADDVKFSLERILDAATASPNRGKLVAIEAIATRTPLTVRITTRAPFAPLLSALTNTRTGTQIVSRAALRDLGPEAFARAPVGSGAYRVRAWRSNERVELEAAPHRLGPPPRSPRVDVLLIPEESSGLTALLGQAVDLTSTAPFADVRALEARASLQVFKQPGLNTRYVALNTRQAPFDDVHVRRALSMAFDRNTLVKAVLFGEGTVTPGLLPPALLAHQGPLPDLVTYDPARARAELAKARYRPEAVAATVLVWGSSWWRRFGEIVVAQINQTLGTRLSVQSGDTNAVFAQLRSGAYQAAVWGWLGLVDYDEYLGDILGAEGARNFQGYANPAFEALLAEGRTTLDPSRRAAIYARADRLMLEDMPVWPAFCSNVHHVATRRLAGFTQLPYSNFGDQFSHLELRA
ncbi:oligopeptide transport system substrate-binding protein [Methylobacterium sp. ap11]|uniref:ABC transporter substrate-binding protein n=1 Tax=Methylobacterium sp. ap11 TaxID=1761799 RepID=UPI0008B9A64C|nr:ABC transporter substrate-binding protein [Methylobacterium sp. ap11]SEP49084.1 oligopeptide transport system substrate-binding protein [Methylobacterium sp. ap11]